MDRLIGDRGVWWRRRRVLPHNDPVYALQPSCRGACHPEAG